LEKEQELQEEEYDFPYHHIAELHRLYCAHTFTFRWGIPYIGGMVYVERILEDLGAQSVIDVGCGDGFFPKFLSKRHLAMDIVGVDYSERAINYARGFSPHLDFRCLNIIEEDVGRKSDVVTMIEVLEHIPPDLVFQFLAAVKRMLKPGGALVLTVPHKNLPLSPKHYRHFDSSLLQETLSPHFSSITIAPFDRRSRVMKFLDFFLNRDDIIINLKSTQWLRWQYYLKYCLFNVSETKCERISAICKV
jgi:2-polyprenyl-3-methyl-5-hydroxy-6-metoxy-1,4-benzoquinol methylase